MLAATVGLWLLTGAGGADCARYLAYELALVIAPGWLILRALAPGIRSSLVQLAIAWPLGLGIELAAFSLTAALDLRDLLPALQLAVGVGGLAACRRRRERDGGSLAAFVLPALDRDRGDRAPNRIGRRGSWLLAGVIVASFAYIAPSLFVTSPLPGTVDAVRYPTDVLFHVSIAADLKHHAFPSTPEVAEVPLRYHYFAYVHHAAASQVTGIELPLVALRFAPLALGTLLLVVIAAASRLFTASSRCAPLAALLFLIASELDLMIADPYPLLGVRDVWFWLSPTYVLGVIVFVLALIAAAALLDRGLAARLGAGPRATWALLLVALLLGSGAKSVVLPTLVGGLGAYAAYAWWRRRAPEPSSIALVLVATVISGLSYALLYLGGGDGGLGVVLGGVYGSMPALAAFEPSLPDSLLAETLFWGVGTALTSVLLFASVAVPLAWRLGPGAPALGRADRMLLCMLVPGIAAWLFLLTDNIDNAYFTALALIAVLPLAAQGTLRALGSLGDLGSRRGAAALALLLLAALLLALSAWSLSREGRPRLAYAVAYAPLLAAAAGAGVWLLRSGPGRRAGVAAAITVALLALAALNPLLDSAPEKARLALRGEPLYELRGGIGREEVEAAEWARDHLPGDAMLATANDTEAGAPPFLLSLRADIPALAERRVLFEGWAYSTRSANWVETVSGTYIPYADRRRLQRRAVFGGDPEALREICKRFGVTHLLLRRNDPRVPPSVSDAGKVAFSNGAFEIVELPFGSGCLEA